MRVSQFLNEQHVHFESLIHPPAFTSQKRAKFLGVPGRQVAKGVLLAGPTGYLLAVLPATEQVDTDALAHHLGGPVRLAADGEVAQVFGDCEWGVVAPFGTIYGLPTFLEESLAVDAWIVLEANSHVEAIRMRCRDFEQLEQPTRLRFARQDQPSHRSSEQLG